MAKKKKQNSTAKKPAVGRPVSKGFYQSFRAILEQARQFSPYCGVSFAIVMT